ncbi:hypothetical protein VIGAN_09135800 [Vigna angularis var. angularis]|uniref:Secreted protein n=1 Tax=Vigna angularis var. angularis TaxID=157739 RepID=A0A0S3SXU4_PHAAN|nr:hypothetical protein VIGAN_09135800 [Vigna angularis var. angularis]
MKTSMAALLTLLLILMSFLLCCLLSFIAKTQKQTPVSPRCLQQGFVLCLHRLETFFTPKFVKEIGGLHFQLQSVAFLSSRESPFVLSFSILAVISASSPS